MNFWQEFNERLWAVVLAIGVHVLMAALVVLGTMSWEPFRKPQPVGLTIEAVIVDTGEIKRQREEAQQALEREERRRQREQELEIQRKREQEQKIRRERELEERRKQEAQDRLQKLRLENERKLQAERERQQKELEDIRKQREAAEKKRKLDEEKLKQIEAQKQREMAEQQRLQREAAEQRKAEEEARAFQAGRQAELGDEYYLAIQQLVTQNWLRPPTAQAGLRCILKIIQIPGGDVISAAIAGRCNADEATRRSIVAAVERSGTLPYRGFEDVFAREIEFTFIYDGD